MKKTLSRTASEKETTIFTLDN